jgi:hypothetical protein
MALTLAGKETESIQQIKQAVPDDATSGAARDYMCSKGCPLLLAEEVIGYRTQSPRALLKVPAGIYVAWIELGYTSADGTITNTYTSVDGTVRDLFHIVVYAVIAADNGTIVTRTMCDHFTRMEIQPSDFGKKLSHKALQLFATDPADAGVKVHRAWPKEVYKLQE